MTETYFPLSLLPAPYDIVWCRFPENEQLGNPGPKPRPAIVLNVATYEDDDTGEVQLIYGTTNIKMMQRRGDFFIKNLAEMDHCGLHKSTRFDLDHIAWIPWAEEWFEVLQGYETPIIGHLTSHKVKLLEVQLAYRQFAKMQAEEEI